VDMVALSSTGCPGSAEATARRMAREFQILLRGLHGADSIWRMMNFTSSG
jgi:hypothetical protein